MAEEDDSAENPEKWRELGGELHSNCEEVYDEDDGCKTLNKAKSCGNSFRFFAKCERETGHMYVAGTIIIF